MRIKILMNGPYIVEGERVIVVDWAGRAYRVESTRFALCRCGASTLKPFCDGTHSKVGFTASESAAPYEIADKA